jgi:TfoX/Sxy family transcriptional regulator of competence genes
MVGRRGAPDQSWLPCTQSSYGRTRSGVSACQRRYDRVVAYNEELAERVRAALADRTDVEEKKMFGGLTFMVAGQMCCGVLKNDLVIRIEPAEFDALVAQPQVRPFDFSGRPMQGMVYVDNGALADPEALRTWVQRGTDYVSAHHAPAKRRRRG